MALWITVGIPTVAVVFGLLALTGTPSDGEGLVLVMRGYVGGIATLAILIVCALLLAVRP